VQNRRLALGFVSVLGGVAYACSDTTGPSRIPASMEIVSGQGQSGTAGAELPNPLVARVLTSSGQPVPGQIVNFRVLKGGGSVFAGAAVTNNDGLAQERWTLGKSVPDSQVVEARAVDASTGAPLVFATFVATALAGAPVALEKTGDSQAEFVNTPLDDSLLIHVTDVNGNPVPGATVTWAVESGHGTVNRASDVTSSTGYASNKWTLGPDVGSQSLRVTVGTALSASFTATGSPPLPYAATKYEGDGQSAAPGTAVAVAPAVRVLDSYGNVRVGIAVTFAVTGGGGSVTGATAVTDAGGIARVGRWVLGTQTGTNSLSATPAGGAPTTFTATAAQSSPDIILVVVKPSGGLVGDTANAEVSVTSRFQLTSVRIAVAGRTASLGPTNTGWRGPISLVGTPRDTMTLVATATDVNGSVGQAVSTFTHDRAPRVFVTQPSDNAVARPTLDIDAACDDDDPNGCTLSVRSSEGALLAGPSASPLHASISLAAFEGHQTTVAITASDSKGQSGRTSRDFWVESSPRLQLFGAAEGIVMDALDSRLLWRSPSRTFAGIRHLSGGTSDTLIASTGRTVAIGYLTPNGAAFSSYSDTPPYALLHLWRMGSLTTKELNSASELAASGPYVIYTTPGPFGQLYRTDVTNGTDLLIATSAAITINSLGENGDVAYTNSSYVITRYRGSTNTAISDGSGGQFWDVGPFTDGVNVVFERVPPCCTGSHTEVWLYDGTSLIMLAQSDVTSAPVSDYVVNGGWTAFTTPDASLQRQIWTRSPTGTLQQVSALGRSSFIRALGTDGSVIFDSGNDRYLATSGGLPARIGSSLGSVVWRNGRFLVLIGNSAFTVTP
jgi:hypothetical protein